MTDTELTIFLVTLKKKKKKKGVLLYGFFSVLVMNIYE